MYKKLTPHLLNPLLIKEILQYLFFIISFFLTFALGKIQSLQFR